MQGNWAQKPELELSSDLLLVERRLAKSRASTRYVAFLAFVSLLCYGFTFSLERIVLDRTSLAGDLAEFQQDIKTLNEEEHTSRITRIVGGSIGFQSIEPHLRRYSRPLSFSIGSAWSDIRRDALEARFVPSKLARVRNDLDSARLLLDDGTRSYQRAASVFRFGFIGLLIATIIGALRLGGETRSASVQAVQIGAEIAQSNLAPDLEANKMRLRHILNHLPLAAARFDSTGLVSVWNPEIERLTGISSEDAIGQPLLAILQCHLPADVMKREFMRIFSGELVEEMHWEYCHPSGLKMSFRASFVPIKNSSNHAIGALAYIHDEDDESRSNELITRKDALLNALTMASPLVSFVLDAANEITAIHGENNQSIRPVVGPANVWQAGMPPELSSAILQLARQTRLERSKQETRCIVHVDDAIYEVELYSAPCAMAEVVVLMGVEQLSESADLLPFAEALLSGNEASASTGVALSWSIEVSEGLSALKAYKVDPRFMFGKWNTSREGCLIAEYSETELYEMLQNLEIDKSLVRYQIVDPDLFDLDVLLGVEGYPHDSLPETA
ncbi:PAS domain S-box protein [Kamptonema cortianum]|nr:PAS domain S-box protein [Geitlerinema splendidum]MDK3155984.1 PAS domain S-box protein [Kamptonema cortianum]